MLCYLYKSDTKEYLGSETCFADPVQKDSYLLPPNSTLVVPPTTGDKKIAVWQDTRWITMDDHRQHMNAFGYPEGGTAYWMPGDTWKTPARYMDKIGPLPAAAKQEAPAKDLATLKDEKRMQIDTETSTAVYNGFDYKDGYHYTYDLFDQQNFLDYSVLAATAIQEGVERVFTVNGHRADGSTSVNKFSSKEFLAFHDEATVFKDKLLAINTSRNIAVDNAKTPAEVDAA